MHREFADWVHDILHTTKGKHHDTLHAWSGACEKVVAALTAAQLNDLVALSFDGVPHQVAFAEKLRDGFKAADIGFRIKDHYSLRVLSGVVLLSFLNETSQTDDRFKLQCFAATAILAASFGLTRTDCRPSNLLEIANDFINRQAAQRREIARVSFKADPQELRRAKQSLKYSQKSSTVFTPEQAKQFSSIVAPFIDLLPSIPAILHNQDILQEETEMAWWVQAGQSRSLECPFDEIPAALLPLVLGFELAERTRVYPSGVAARHLIAHVLKLNGQRNVEVSFDDLVQNLSESWVKMALLDTPPNAPRTTPLLHLLDMWQARGGQWAKEYFEMAGIDPATRIAASTLGYAFYQECLSARLLRDA